MSTRVSVQQVDELPAGLDQLIVASTRESFRFLERLRDEWDSGANRFDECGEALFVAYFDSSLAGVCGLNRDPYASRSDVGRLRRLYVGPRFRRQGVARCLVTRALSLAREYYGTVRIRTDNPSAAEFYEAFGFISATPSTEATHQLVLAQITRSHPSR